MSSRRLIRDPIFCIVAVAVICASALLAVPAFLTVASSFTPGMLLEGNALNLENYRRLLSNPTLLTIIKNTLLVGLGTVVVMFVFTIPFSWLYARTDLPGKNLLLLMLTIKVAVPGYLTAMAYIFLLNPESGIINRTAISLFGLERAPFTVYSLWWIAALQGMGVTSSAFFMMTPAFRALDSALEESAYASGVRKATTALRITLPLLAPAIVAAGIFYFVVAIELFDYAGTLGLPTRTFVFATWIYLLTHPDITPPDFGGASVVAVLFFGVVGVLMVIYFRVLRQAERAAVMTGRRGYQNVTRLGWLGMCGAWTFILLYMTVDVFVPVLTLIWSSVMPYLQPPSLEALRSISLQSYRLALEELWLPVKNTAVVMLTVPTVAVLSTACMSWVALRTRIGGRKLIDVLVSISQAVPSIVLGLAFFYLGISLFHLVPLYSTIWIVVLALSVRYMTFSMRTINSSMIQIHQELEEAGYSAGVPKGRMFLSVIVPIVRPSMIFAWFWVALLAARELSIPVMLARPGTDVLSTTIWGFQASGQYSISSAMGVMFAASISVIALLFHRLTKTQRI